MSNTHSVFPNRYPGNCRTCAVRLAPGLGRTARVSGEWVTWCRDHVPAKTTVTAEMATPAVRALSASGVVAMGYEPEALPLIRSMPGARWDASSKTWRVSTAHADLPRTLELARRLGLSIAPELLTTEAPASVLEAARRATQIGCREYQVEGVRRISARTHTLLADDQGLGKTIQALAAIPAQGRAIVIAPANVKYNWRDETRRFRPDLSARVISGKGQTLAAILPQPGEIVILNYDILPVVPETVTPEEQALMQDVLLIVDEAHRAKSYKTQRAKRLTALAALAGRVLGMTGTPIPNRPLDLWGVLSSLGMQTEVFGSYGKFARLFGAQKNRFGGTDFPDYRTRPVPAEVTERLRRVMIRRLKSEVLAELPAKTYRTVKIELGKTLSKALDRIEDEWGDSLAMGELPAFEELSKIRADLARDRIGAAVEMVEEFEEADKPLLVFSAHREPVEAIGSREGWAIIAGGVDAETRQDIVRRFQAGELKGVALTIRAGSEGLTLTRAADVLFVDLDWTPALNRQAEDRVHRIGQTESVTIHRLVSDHPVDMRVQDLLLEKDAMSEQTLQGSLHYAPKAEAAPREIRTVEIDLDKMAEDDAARIEESRTKAVTARASVLRGRGMAREIMRPWTAEVTEEIKEAVTAAHSALADHCDGAEKRDGAGYNKPDASNAMFFGILDCEESTRARWHLAWKYKKQLKRYLPAEQFKLLYG